MYFIPFAVSLNTSKPKRIEENINILTIGKYEIRKNHMLLLEVISKLGLKILKR